MKSHLLLPTLLLPVLAVFGCSSSDSDVQHKATNGAESTTSANTDNKSSEENLAELKSDKPADSNKAQLFENLGDYGRKITTGSPEAQEFFNQGLTWMSAFNHDEAIRSFKKAAELDADCAMAWWGVSLAAGPQYNHAVMTEARTATAWEAMQNALQRIENTMPLERALIEALKLRNPELEPDDRAPLNKAYAEAMGEIWEAHPDDPDIGALYAEAMMVRIPWMLYELDHEPNAETAKITSTLERIMELDPDHPAALHLYIHATEPSKNPGQGLVAADRLSDLVPASGHLSHMPAHIYVKTGLWDKAIIQSEKAMRADKEYRVLSPVQGVQHFYMAHNTHMLAYAAMMSGRENEAMAAARNMWENVSDDTLQQLGPVIDRVMCSVYDVQKRFGRWDAILDEKAPPSHMILTTTTWHAARAVAYAAKKDFPNAEREYEAFKSAKAGVPKDTKWARDVAQDVLDVSDYFIAGEIALQKDEWDKAAELLEKAAAIEDTLGYGEPPQWLQPVRHTLGAVYMKSGKYAEAERVYREDLAKWPNNGWSLYGVSQALERQGKTEEAKEAMEEHQRIWAKADSPIATSCKCIPKT
jgi:tetratricopeptide (TPR) repeat protein